MKRTAVVVLVLLAACSSGGSSAAPTSAPSTTASQTVAPPEAVDVCRVAVKDKLVDPTSARFDAATAPAMNTAGTSWQIRGTVTSGGHTINYSCLVNPSTVPGDSVPWVIGDVTVTPG